MNVILLEAEDFLGDARVRIAGRRLRHVRDVLRARPGDRLRVGRLGGRLGSGRILELGGPEAVLDDVRLDTPPPEPLPVTLVVALPRPPSLRKVLQQATAMGVKEFVLLHTRRVEKSYWQSRGLEPDAVRHQLLLGLEQAVDTTLPQVSERRRFRPFVDDELPERAAAGPLLFADPEASAPCPQAGAGTTTLVVGPEGGFVPFERERLEAAGARGVALGPRVLRVETAVVALLARLGA